TIWKYRGLLRDATIASLFIQVFALASPLVFMVVIDKVLSHQNMSTLDVLVIALATISVFDIGLTALRSYLISHTNYRIDAELSARFLRHLLRLPVSYFESRSTGDVMARIRELEHVRHFITGPALSFVLDALFMGVFLLVMFQFSPFLTAIVLTILPVFFLISLLMTPFLRQKLEDKFKHDAKNQAFLVEAITGIKTVKGTGSEPRFNERWEKQLGDTLHTAFKGGQFNNVVNQTIAFLSKASVVVILWFGAQLVMAGDMTVGQLIAFNMLASRVNAPILRIAQIWQDFQQMRTSVRRLAEVMETPTEISFSAKRTRLPSIKGKIEFRNVSFSYRPEGPEVLKNINLSFQPGQLIGISGPSGSGKSTLLKLLRRFYVPDSGQVLIDGIDLSSADASWLRRQVAVVSSEDLLFDASVRDNIIAGDPSISPEAMMAAAETARAHDFVLEFPEQYDTLVGERGQKVSAGQGQRILLARALARNPRILILDEATNYLDLENERALMDRLSELAKDRTVIIASHRISLLGACNSVYYLRHGQVVGATGDQYPAQDTSHGMEATAG
ncbi:MAG: peptidase domain-containing ABC transporter, partial [Gammaproteobacteria bacterium]